MAALRASGGEGGAAASAARLVEWHTKLGEARLREMRLGREKDQLRDQVTPPPSPPPPQPYLGGGG